MAPFAVLTRAGAPFGVALLEQLADAGHRPSLIVIEHTTWSARITQARRLAKRIGLRDAVIYNLHFWKVPLMRQLSGGLCFPLPDYRRFGAEVLEVNSINESQVYSEVVGREIHRVLLGQSGIVRGPLVSDPSRIILNAHPGRLPLYRGVDCVKWALWEGVLPGVTLHRVDAGVDTGGILAVEDVEINEGDDVATIEARANRRCRELLVASLGMTDEALKGASPQVKEAGRQYYLMPRRQVRALKERGKGRALLRGI